MTRDEIYDHLAKVYLGKKEQTVSVKPEQPVNAWLVLNIMITVLILTSAFYGFTAFLTNRGVDLKNKVVFSLSNSPIRMAYNVVDPYPQVKTFELTVPDIDVSKYGRMNFTARALEDGSPGTVRIVLTNRRNEVASYYIRDIAYDWKNYSVAFEDLNLTDWSSLKDIAFVIEAWNADDPTGVVLIDDISFSN